MTPPCPRPVQTARAPSLPVARPGAGSATPQDFFNATDAELSRPFQGAKEVMRPGVTSSRVAVPNETGKSPDAGVTAFSASDLTAASSTTGPSSVLNKQPRSANFAIGGYVAQMINHANAPSVTRPAIGKKAQAKIAAQCRRPAN